MHKGYTPRVRWDRRFPALFSRFSAGEWHQNAILLVLAVPFSEFRPAGPAFLAGPKFRGVFPQNSAKIANSAKFKYLWRFWKNALYFFFFSITPQNGRVALRKFVTVSWVCLDGCLLQLADFPFEDQVFSCLLHLADCSFEDQVSLLVGSPLPWYLSL